MEIQKIKSIIKPLIILSVSVMISTVLVGMIAYSNCPEAKVFIDNLLGNPVVTESIGQA